MTGIGGTLREARIRAKIDITEVESKTKIRAKYLRALENEEWGALPGPTYVKSFLRTYAEFLGLDARRLLDDYKSSYERPAEAELSPISPNLGRERRRDRRLADVSPFGAGVIGVLALALVALWVIGKLVGGSSESAPPAAPPAASTPRRPPPATTVPTTPVAPPAPARARVWFRAQAPVYVCLVDSRGRRLIPGVILQAGARTRTYRARRMLVTLGNGHVRMALNGNVLGVPQSATPLGYTLTGNGRTPLPAARQPTCA